MALVTESDEFGFRPRPTRQPCMTSMRLLHLMGLDHERLTFYHNGLERRLTNVHGHVIKEVIA